MSILLFDLMLYILPISLLIKMGCFQKVVVLNDTHFFSKFVQSTGQFPIITDRNPVSRASIIVEITRTQNNKTKCF